MERIVNGTLIQNRYDDIARGMVRLGELFDRRDEREARYAVMQATDLVKNGWHGTDSVDPQTGKAVHAPGIADLGWRDLDAEKSSVARKTDEMLKSVREQDFYKNLNANQKRLFDKSWFFKESELHRAAAARHGELVRQKANDEDKDMMLWDNKRVEEVFGRVDGEYEKRRNWATVQNFGVMMGTSLKNRDLLDRPDITFDDIASAEKWDEKTTDLYRFRFDRMRDSFDLMRIDALIEAGANNQSIGAYSPQAALVEAARLTNVLNGNTFGVDEKTGAKKHGKDKNGNDLPPGEERISDQMRNKILANVEKADASRMRKAALAQNDAFEKAKAKALEVEVQLHAIPVPNDTTAKAAFFGEMSKKYQELAADQSLPPETRLKYAKTARALEKDAFDGLNVAIREKQNETFSVIETDFLAGGYCDENGKWTNYDSTEMKDHANTLLSEGRITREQWSKLMKIQHKTRSDEMDCFRSRVFDRLRSVVPSCVATGPNGFRFANAKGRTLSSTAFTNNTGWFSSDVVTYRQLVDAMNLTMDWWQQRGKGASLDDALAHFDELTKGIVAGKRQKDIDAALEEEKQIVNDWRNSHGL